MKLLVLSNKVSGLLNFRREVIESFIAYGYEVVAAVPYEERISELESMGVRTVSLPISRRSVNPIKDLMLIIRYWRLLKKETPSVVLTYTIKPNLYGGFVCGLCKVPQIANITGLGTAVENKSILQRILFFLYRIGLKDAERIFFQNQENMDFCTKHKLVPNVGRLIPGSGVNLQRYAAQEYPKGEVTKFIFISRIMKQKGIDQYLDAARVIRKEYPNTEFHILGYCEDAYEETLKKLTAEGVVIYHGVKSDVRPYLKQVHCTIHPTYYPEGMSNVLLESCATARPVITTNRAGCREIVEDGINGFVVEQQNSADLVEKVRKFLSLSYDEKKEMGRQARIKVENQFDRQIVVDAYMNAVVHWAKDDV